jgi:enoyl-CoA hydratase/carnithine racemase
MSGEKDGERVASASELLYEKDGHIATIILNRPHRGNALTPAMHDRIHAIWRDVQEDDDIRVAIITGAGDRHFSTGADVDVIAERGRVTQGSGPLHTEVFWSPRHANVLKPVICAVNGVCAGAGLHFVADADIVLASPAASFMDTHVNVGMVGGVENTALAYRLPLGSVLRMTLMGKDYRMPATRAYELGLVDEVIEQDQLMKSAQEMAAVIAANSPAAVQRSKQAIWQSREVGYANAAEYGWALVRMHWGHPDFREGPLAFREKRPPNWAST